MASRTCFRYNVPGIDREGLAILAAKLVRFQPHAVVHFFGVAFGSGRITSAQVTQEGDGLWITVDSET